MSEKIGDIGEFGLIRRIDELLRRDGVVSEGVTLGIGDDTASFLPRPGFELLVTCDSMVEGRHYLPGSISPFDLGRRAMTQNISDIGAMGGHPLYALVSLGLRAETEVTYVEEMYRGFLAELNPFAGSIIGGNLTKSGDGVFIDITVIGEVERGRGVSRSGARPGNAILVTGFPGRAAAGLQLLLRGPGEPGMAHHPLIRAYNAPGHRAVLGRALAKTGYVTAMIDTSDGFLGDLGHICERSRVGAELFDDRIPVNEEMVDAARRLDRLPGDFFFGDSDDYELVLTCLPQHVDLLRSVAAREGVEPFTEVGRITAREGITLLLADGTEKPLGSVSWDHFRSI